MSKTVWIYTYKRESDEDYMSSSEVHLIRLKQFFNMEISGLPTSKGKTYAKT